jgi:hypothetical protein
MLMGIGRRNARAKACLKVLIDGSAAMASHAPAPIGAPSAEHAIALAEIAGTAWAASWRGDRVRGPEPSPRA